MKDNLKIALGVIIIIVIFLTRQAPETRVGSIDGQSAYVGTTTDSTWNAAALQTGGFKLLRNGPGILGSIIINNSTLGSFTLYDATTTVNGGVYGTTTLAKAVASVAAGTYTYDVAFSRGLIAEFQSSNVASSTITQK